MRSADREGPLLVATRNRGKLRELRPLFTGAGIRVIDLEEAGLPPTAAEDDLEHHERFEDNALAKARYFHALSGLPTVADDSGLEVVALGGRPGVRSRRFAGEPGLEGAAQDAANNARLLRELAGVAARGARFVCAAAFVDGGRELVQLGTIEGEIVDEARGAHGFGYDPYFRSREAGKTLAELEVWEKERISHRGRAFAALVEALSASPSS
jgi:XTP/dITP diphosphohydrolase